MRKLTSQEAALLVERGLTLLRLIASSTKELDEIKRRLRQDAEETCPESAKLFTGPSGKGSARVTEPLAPQVVFAKGVSLESVPELLRKHLVQEVRFKPSIEAEALSEFRERGLVELIAHERRVTFKD